MSANTFPTVPPRPSRSPNPSSRNPEMPKVPPRPTSRRVDCPASPSRDSYAPSPLNELPTGLGPARSRSKDASRSQTPARPPSVSLPSVGQEGEEYESLLYQNASWDDQGQRQEQPVETRNVHQDLHIHAPRPSLPTSTVKAQVAVVTRTALHQAAAAGFGKAVSPGHDETDHSRSRNSLTNNGSRRGSSTASTNHRSPLHLGDEGGIPEIGQRVPMDPNAGDVQAPSPAPFGDVARDVWQRSGRQHQRTKSGREGSLPPGSYGLHGHGVQPNDKFEQAWYDSHPDEFAREEQGQYGPGLGNQRPEWAMSSNDLNTLVRTSANRGLGLATHANVVGTPEEEVGYIATDELASRLASPHTGSSLAKGEYIKSQSFIESPRKKSVVLGALDTEHDVSTVDTLEKEEVIHIDEPLHHQHHPDGFAPAPEDHKPHNLQSLEEPGRGEGSPDEAPVLASDEIDPGIEHMQPAVSPVLEPEPPSRTHSASHMRPSSRPVNMHGAGLNSARLNSRGEEREEIKTALEDVQELEPLFPEDDDVTKITSTDRFKRRPEQHRFPSKDIWEDSPDSLQLEATVTTPDIPIELNGAEDKCQSEPSSEQQTLQIGPSSPSKEFQSHLEDEKPPRPDSRQRFPSNDIWEDAPDSHQLVTTVQHIPEEEETTPTSPQHSVKPTFPTIPARPSKSTNVSPVEAKSTSPTELRKPPAVPNRPKPKPHHPAPLARPTSHNSEENLPKTSSASSAEPTPLPATKPKPPIPSRPGGSKIAALKGGFLADLEGRLKLGPKPLEKKAEPEESSLKKAPLSDARKGRARGPARRKPAVAAGSASEPAKESAVPEIRSVGAWDVWQIGRDGVLVVVNACPSISKSKSPSPDIPEAAIQVPAAERAESSPCDLSQDATIPQPPGAYDLSTETSSKPAAVDHDESSAAAAARDLTLSSSSPRNVQVPTTMSSHDDLDTPVEAEIEPHVDTPLAVSEPAAQKPISAADEGEEQTSVAPEVEEKISEPLDGDAASS
ncbi:hypothetical protein PABG_02280 [Paracoccidioides brasiliensis Pb03]|nr:hypothetical protein PABG_02280 [Paracoccidioides brasiliensis Pb03]